MVLCKFFQQGSCRFGSKCHNEHFDVKQVLKTDVEGAINGKQWPLSTYGPFKDKPSIPNFIEDQSFEEVRLLCYEAKAKNCFEQFHREFSKSAMDGSNKMKALLQMTPEILEVVINCYDAPDSGTGSVANANNPSNNPFGSMGGNVASAGSLFAKQANTSGAGNIFGNAAATPNSGGGMFGAAANTQPSNLFGATSAFGQTQQQPQQQSSIFAQAAVKPANSIFGGGAGNQQQQQTSMFGQQAAAVAGGNLFAQPQAPSAGGYGLFSQQPQQQQTSMFSQQPTQQSNIFAQSQNQPAQATNLFAQAAAQQPPPQGLFSQAAATMPPPQQQAIHNQGIFGQAAAQPQTMQQSGQGMFSQASQQSQNVFGQAMQQPQQQMTTNMFQQTQSNQQQLPTTASGIFQQAAQQNPPGYNAAVQAVASTVYSRMEDLTPDEIESFKADYFQPGKVPCNPPPRELVN